MSELILRSLEIQNYRALRHLQIAHLGRVNLIVGRNNVGKTSILEALWIYTQSASPNAFFVPLNERDEVASARLSGDEHTDIQLEMLKNLFSGRKKITEASITIQIGEVGSEDKRVRFGIGLYTSANNDKDDGSLIIRRLLTSDEYTQAENPIQQLGIQVGLTYRRVYDLTAELQDQSNKASPLSVLCVYVTTYSLTSRTMNRLWDKVALTSLEEHVLTALQLIEPTIERITLISNPDTAIERIPIVRVKGLDAPIPLRSMGDGAIRLFGIALSMVNAKDGVLLLDEIENGLHYSAQPDVWRLIFHLAQRLNIQVFATTHSSDCVRAFQQAASEHAEDGMLIRLGRKNGEVVATLFDEEELEIAVSEQVEVR